MRVMFVVAGGASHLFPLVPLAWGFRVAGHEVRLVGKPQATELLLHTGLAVVTLGEPPRLSERAREELVRVGYGQPPWPADWPTRPESLTAQQKALLEVWGRYTVAVADAMADDLVAFARRWRPELIVYETLALGAEVAAAQLGAPCVRYSHGTQDVFRTEYRISDGQPIAEYAAMFERFGLESPNGTPPSYVDTMPPSMFLGAERPSVEMRWIPHNGPGTAPDGLTGPRRRPRVCVTWGGVGPSALGSAAADLYREVIAAVAGAGAEVLALTSEAQIDALGTPPDGARFIAGAPLNLVLPYCDAIVHHGGEGSGMAAAALAVPQLIITRDPLDDQFGGRLAATGAAIHLRHQHLEGDPTAPGRIRDAIGALLSDPGHAEAAARLQEDMRRQPAPSDVVPTLAAGRLPHVP